MIRLVKLTPLMTLPFLLISCSSTLIESHNVSGAAFEAWSAQRDTIPVELHGTVPGDAAKELASLFPSISSNEFASLEPMAPAAPLKRIVLYVNAEQLPSEAGLCSRPEEFRSVPQAGRLAKIVAALCDGKEVISTSSGYALSRDQSRAGLRLSFEATVDGLFQALVPSSQEFQIN